MAFGPWVGPAAAGDPDRGSLAADDLILLSEDQLESNELVQASGGSSIEQTNVTIPIAENENTFGQINTGDINSTSRNTGVIDISMLNTGAGVVMQSGTNINNILGAGGLD